MSSIALGMQVNGLEARIRDLEGKVSALLAMYTTGLPQPEPTDTETRLAQLESMVAMMRHAIDVAVLNPAVIYDPATERLTPVIEGHDYVGRADGAPDDPYLIAAKKPAKVKATRA